MEENPFKTNDGGSQEPGTYRAELEEITVKDSPPFEPGGPTRKALVFRFRTSEGGQITKIVNASNHEKSNCVQLAKSLSPTPPSPDQMRDPGKFWTFINTLRGSEYLVQSEPSACGRYNNFISAVLVPKDGFRHR
jgi:hypothetical protein